MRQRFEMMRDALNRTGKAITYAIDDWGVTNTWNYGQEVRECAFDVMRMSWMYCYACTSRRFAVICVSLDHCALMCALPGVPPHSVC